MDLGDSVVSVFWSDQLKLKDGRTSVWCQKCIEEYLAERKRELEWTALDRKRPAKTPEQVWRDICPEEYRTEQEGGVTCESTLRTFEACGGSSKWRLGFEPDLLTSKRPLLIAGPPGSMKTRVAWRLARSAFDAGLPIHAFTCWSFQAAAQKAAGEYRSDEWLKSLLKGFILIDDLGKSPWTDYTAATFFELVEQVVAHHSRLVITANDTSVELANSIGSRKTISPEIGSGILRRIQEHFLRVVAVKPKIP